VRVVAVFVTAIAMGARRKAVKKNVSVVSEEEVDGSLLQ
jgi:hypothetical protein